MFNDVGATASVARNIKYIYKGEQNMEGAFTALITPFENGKIDYKAFEYL